MLGRNNIFDRSNNTNNSYSSTTNYNSGTGGGYSRQLPACGSNRLDYKFDNLSPGTADLISLWKQFPPTSISCRLQTFHLHPIELRIQDYHLIRTNKLRSYQMDKVKTAIKNDSFNEEILKIQSHKLPQVSSQRSMDFEAFKRAIRGESNLSYSRGYNGSGNANTNIFSSNSGSSPNVFNNNNQGGTSNNNIFMNTSHRNSNNNTNIFGNTSGGSGNRTQQSNNIFGVGSSNNAGTSSFSNNIFSNKSTLNTGANIFGGNNNGNNNSNTNIFNSRVGNQSTNNNPNNNTQGTNQGTNNIFNNNSNPTNNIFMMNRNNNQPSNNNSNNMFNNSYNSNNNSYSNNQHSNSDLNTVMLAIQNCLQTTQQYIAQLHRQKQANEDKEQDDQNYQENYQQPQYKQRSKEDAFDLNNINLEEFSKWDTINPREDVVVMAPHLNKWKMGKQLTNSMEDEVQMNHSWLGLPVHSRIIKQQPALQSQSIQMHSRMINTGQSMRYPTVRETYNYESSMIHSRIGRKHHEIHIERDCKVKFKLEIIWISTQKHNNKTASIPSKEVQGYLEIQSLDLQTEEGNKTFIRDVAANQKLGIRMDAVLKVDRRKSKVDLNISQATIVGKLEQRLVNLQGDYQVFYSRVREGFISDFTISNAYGTIAWNNPIPYQCLDFQRGYDFSIDNNEIDCKLPSLQSSCRVRFSKAPKSILKTVQEKGLKEAKKQLEKKVKQNGQGIELLELWENGQWCLLFKNGFV